MTSTWVAGRAGDSTMDKPFDSLQCAKLAHVPADWEFTCRASLGPVPDLAGGADHASNKRIDAVVRPQCGERHRRIDADALAVRRHGGVFQNAGEPASDDMRGAQVGIGEHRKNRIVGLAASEI